MIKLVLCKICSCRVTKLAEVTEVDHCMTSSLPLLASLLITQSLTFTYSKDTSKFLSTYFTYPCSPEHFKPVICIARGNTQEEVHFWCTVTLCTQFRFLDTIYKSVYNNPNHDIWLLPIDAHWHSMNIGIWWCMIVAWWCTQYKDFNCQVAIQLSCLTRWITIIIVVVIMDWLD